MIGIWKRERQITAFVNDLTNRQSFGRQNVLCLKDWLVAVLRTLLQELKMPKTKECFTLRGGRRWGPLGNEDLEITQIGYQLLVAWANKLGQYAGHFVFGHLNSRTLETTIRL